MTDSTPVNPFKQTENGAVATEASPALVAPFGNPVDEDNYSVDLTNAQAGGVITPGRYIFRLSDLEKGTSNKTNAPMWTFSFEILADGKQQATPFAGRVLKRWCVISDAALFALVGTLEALDLAVGGKPANFSKSDALNRMVYGEVIAGEYEGRKTSNLDTLAPFDPPGKKYSRANAGINI